MVLFLTQTFHYKHHIGNRGRAKAPCSSINNKNKEETQHIVWHGSKSHWIMWKNISSVQNRDNNIKLMVKRWIFCLLCFESRLLPIYTHQSLMKGYFQTEHISVWEEHFSCVIYQCWRKNTQKSVSDMTRVCQSSREEKQYASLLVGSFK